MVFFTNFPAIFQSQLGHYPPIYQPPEEVSAAVLTAAAFGVFNSFLEEPVIDEQDFDEDCLPLILSACLQLRNAVRKVELLDNRQRYMSNLYQK